MIWHLFEVWVLMLAAFAIGCPIGAVAYKLIAASPLAELQGDLADVVGDLVDDVKRRFGIGPVWRPEYRHAVERAARGVEDMDEDAATGVEGTGWPDRLPGSSGLPAIADRFDEAAVDEAGAAAADSPAPAALDEAGEPADSEETATARPVALTAPRNGVPDDLQRIRGIGRRIENRLNRLGIFHFGQIAAWTPAEMRWMAQQLAFPERIERDDWIGQAIVLAAGGDTGFVKSADRRRAQRRQRALEDAIARGADADDTADYEAGEATGEEAALAETESPSEAAEHPEMGDRTEEPAGPAEAGDPSGEAEPPEGKDAPEDGDDSDAEDKTA